MAIEGLKILSVAYWDERYVRLGNTWNRSDDTHDSIESAEAICRRLTREGFGGEGKHFPTNTLVEVWLNGHRVDVVGWLEEETYFERRRSWNMGSTQYRVIDKRWGPKWSDNPTLQYCVVTWDPRNLITTPTAPNGACEVRPPHP